MLPLVALLGADVARRVSPYSAPDLSWKEALFLAVVAGVIPMLTAHSISMNRRSSRWLLLALATGLLLTGVGWFALAGYSGATVGVSATAGCVLLLALCWWLFRSPRMRVYYALISGRAVPTELGYIDLSASRQGVVVRALRATVPYLEGLVVLVVLGAVLWGLLLMG